MYSLHRLELIAFFLQIVAKLVVEPPSPELVELYLYEIAKAYSIDWRPQGFPDPNAPVVPPSVRPCFSPFCEQSN